MTYIRGEAEYRGGVAHTLPKKYVKPSRTTVEHCFFCNTPIPQLRRRRYVRGRLVVFCGWPKNCLKKYEAANPPAKEILPSRPEEITKRAMEKLKDYKTDVLFLPTTSHARLEMEAFIFELTEIVEGRQRVTIHERSAP